MSTYARSNRPVLLPPIESSQCVQPTSRAVLALEAVVGSKEGLPGLLTDVVPGEETGEDGAGQLPVRGRAPGRGRWRRRRCARAARHRPWLQSRSDRAIRAGGSRGTPPGRVDAGGPDCRGASQAGKDGGLRGALSHDELESRLAARAAPEVKGVPELGIGGVGDDLRQGPLEAGDGYPPVGPDALLEQLGTGRRRPPGDAVPSPRGPTTKPS